MASTTLKVEVPHPISTTTTINGLNNIGITETLKVPDPIVTAATQTLKIPDPIVTNSTQALTLTLPQPLETKSDINTNSDARQALAIDLKPVSLDLCLNTSSKLPQGCIHQPFNVHFGFTMFGMEVFGVNFGGESRVTLTDLPKRPAVDWPAQQNACPPPAECAPTKPAGHAAPAVHQHGLRVRVR